MAGLPEFKRQSRNHVVNLLVQVFTRSNEPDVSYFRRLIEHEDGHYSVIFGLDYFASTDVPTKSQWNTLKKKLKRHDKKIFVFKEQKVMQCEAGDVEMRCGQLEFGFFAR